MKLQSFEFNLFGELTYVVWNQKTHEGVVIDPGMSNDLEQQQFARFIEENGIRLKYLLYTHLHIDHTLGHEFVSEKYALLSMAHPNDAPLGQTRAAQAQMFRLRIPQPKGLTADSDLFDGQILPIGDESLEVIYVPGHSPGSVAYYCKESDFVLTGDALFNGSIGRTDLPGGDHQQLISSIENRLLTLPDDTKVYPGHGPDTTIGDEKLHNPYI